MPTQPQPLRVNKPSYANGKEIAKHIFLEVMTAIDVRRAMRAKLKLSDGTLMAGEAQIPLLRPPRVVAIGKAANRMATSLHEIMGGRVEAGVVIAPADPVKKLDRFRY